MPKFKVVMNGSGCLIAASEKRWGLLPRTALKPVGFYTTRFVEALCPEDAIRQAISLTEEELKTVNRSQSPPRIVVDEVEEEATGYEMLGAGSGFSWYHEKER